MLRTMHANLYVYRSVDFLFPAGSFAVGALLAHKTENDLWQKAQFYLDSARRLGYSRSRD